MPPTRMVPERKPSHTRPINAPTAPPSNSRCPHQTARAVANETMSSRMKFPVSLHKPKATLRSNERGPRLENAEAGRRGGAGGMRKRSAGPRRNIHGALCEALPPMVLPTPLSWAAGNSFPHDDLLVHACGLFERTPDQRKGRGIALLCHRHLVKDATETERTRQGGRYEKSRGPRSGDRGSSLPTSSLPFAANCSAPRSSASGNPA